MVQYLKNMIFFLSLPVRSCCCCVFIVLNLVSFLTLPLRLVLCAYVCATYMWKEATKNKIMTYISMNTFKNCGSTTLYGQVLLTHVCLHDNTIQIWALRVESNLNLLLIHIFLFHFNRDTEDETMIIIVLQLYYQCYKWGGPTHTCRHANPMHYTVF